MTKKRAIIRALKKLGMPPSATEEDNERIDNKASSAVVKEKRTECVWTNFNP